MALSPFKKNLVINGGIGIVLIGITVGVTIFLGSDINTRAAHLRELRDEEHFRSEAIESFVALKGEYSKAQAYFSLLENILPHQDRLLSFPKDMRAIAKKHKLDFTVTFGTQVEGGPDTPGYINFQMALKGSFDNFTLFLKEAQQSLYIIDFTSMETNWEKAGVSVTILGKVFSR
jgi:Tfp pilus assembly protein PilO